MGFRFIICLFVVLAFFSTTFATDTSSTYQKSEKTQNQTKRRFVGLTGGILNFPTSSNIQQINGAGGFNIGVALPYSFWLEGEFNYSYQQIADSVGQGMSDVDQYSLIAKPTYHWDIPDFWVTPIVGLAVTYTIRSYNSFSNKSNAFELGPVVAFDIDLMDSFAVGVEYRYMMSLGYSSDVESGGSPKLKTKVATNTTVANQQRIDLESLNYQVLMLNAKWKF